MIVNRISDCFFNAVMFSCSASCKLLLPKAKVSNTHADVVSRVVCIYS